MNTISWRAAAAAVTGTAHQRARRNGQDAAAAWAGERGAAIVVCDGCSAGSSSEVGARLGARWMLGALASRLEAGAEPDAAALWASARADVAHAIAGSIAHLPGDRATALREHFLFTIVAAAVSRDRAAVWLLGDGGYAIDGRVRVLGPFPDNQPPYLAYDLLGEPGASHLEPAVAPTSIVVATDGASALPLARFALARYVDHPDALRRELARHARAEERIDWDARRVVRTSAALTDDGALGLLWRPT
jgi:hypothetical protein